MQIRAETTIITDAPCHRCDTLENPHCSMAMSAEHRSNFAALQRQWWRLHMSEKFSSGTKNSKQINKQRLVPMIFEGVIFTLYMFYVRQMGRWMVPRVKDNNPLGTLKTVSLDFEEKLAREGRQGNWSLFSNSRRRYMAEILPIRRINQSIFSAL